MIHRGKRTPGQFLLRLKVPNGIINSDQMRFYADCIEKYGEERGVLDITTRQNMQLRGIKLEDAPAVFDGLHVRNQKSFQSTLDNVRNMVGSPLTGIDDLNDLVSLHTETGTCGNPVWGNLPRNFNIALFGPRDDFLTHTSMIWDFNLVSMMKLVLWDLILFWADTCLSNVWSSPLIQKYGSLLT